MDQFVQFAAYVAVIAVGAERLTDIIKRMYLADKNINSSVYQLLTFVCGIVVSIAQPPDFKFFNFNPYMIAVLTGFAVSGTSSAWHEFLMILSNFNKLPKPISPEVK